MYKIFILIAIITFSCGNTKNSPEPVTEPKPNSVIQEEEEQKDMLLGEFTKDDLQQKPFSSWFEPRYEEFSPNEEAMTTIKENIGNYEIEILMGTWCGDSKREVPKFLKILDQANFNYDKLDMHAVDYNKTTPSKIEEKLKVHRVPTIIFYKDGKEVNRFVEYSQGESIEEDIAKIVSGKEYKNSYAE